MLFTVIPEESSSKENAADFAQAVRPANREGEAPAEPGVAPGVAGAGVFGSPGAGHVEGQRGCGVGAASHSGVSEDSNPGHTRCPGSASLALPETLPRPAQADLQVIAA
jgi:hypothetical protein